MAGEWPTVPLGALLQPGRSISYGIVQPGQHDPDGVPIVRVSDVRDGRIATENPLRVSKDIEKQYARTRLRGGELLLTLVGTVGEAAIAPPELAGWNLARAVAVIPVSEEVGPFWVKAALRAPKVRNLIQARLNTTVQATLNLSDVAELPIVVPPTGVRAAIVEVLGALDGKIELGRHMAETLESMARALFESWFVDFGPVAARAQGRPTGLSDDLSAQFPNSFGEDREPAGWRDAPILDVFDLLGGGTPKTSISEYWNGEIPWFSVVDAPQDFVPFVIATERAITPLGLENCASPLIPEGATIITARGTVGKLAVVGTPMAMNQSCYAARPRGGYTNYFVYFLLRNVIEDLKARSHGSVFSTITRQTFDSVRAHLPPPEVAMLYEKLVDPLMSRIKSLAYQARALTQVRDTLLPRLISGELPISSAEEQIAVA